MCGGRTRSGGNPQGYFYEHVQFEVFVATPKWICQLGRHWLLKSHSGQRSKPETENLSIKILKSMGTEFSHLRREYKRNVSGPSPAEPSI